MSKNFISIRFLINILAMVSGVYYFYRLNWIEGIQLFKLFNVWGLVFDIIAIVLLSTFFPLAFRLQRFIVDKVSFEFVALLIFFQVGVLITAGYAVIWGLPSVSVFAMFHSGLLIPLVFVWFIVEDLVSNTMTRRIRNDDNFRMKIFGSIFLIFGLILQLIGAILDLVGS